MFGSIFGGAGAKAAAPAPALPPALPAKKPAIGGGSAIPTSTYGPPSMGGAGAGAGGASRAPPFGGFGPGAGTRTGSGSEPAGGDMFGSLSVKVGSGAGGAPAGGGLLSGLNVAGAAPAPAVLQATGFDFMGGGGGGLPTGPAPAAAATGFDFMGGGGGAAPAAPAAGGFAFLSGAAASAVAPAPAPDMGEAASSGIKKKKGGFRPGFDRSVDAGAGAPSSLLSGLTVQGGGEGEGGEGEGGSSLLSGMQLHGGGGAEGGEEPPLGLLAGLQVQAQAEPAAEEEGTFARLLKLTAAAPVLTAPAPAPAPFEAPSLPSPPLRRSAPASTDSTSAKKAAVLTLSEAASSTRLRLADLKIRLRAIGEEGRRASAEVDRLRGSLGDVEARQDEAVRTENFDAAERIGEEAEGVRAQLAAAEGKRAAVLVRRRKTEEEHEGVLAEQAAVALETLSAVRSYEGERAGALASFLADAVRRHGSGAERLAGEEEQLRLKAEGVAREGRMVGEESGQTERAIAEQSEELARSVVELTERVGTLGAEVAALEAALKAKQAEARSASSQLADAEGRIATIRAKFDKQTKRLAAKRVAVDQEAEECANESAAIARAKREYASNRARDRAAERALLRQMGAAGLDVGSLQALSDALSAAAGKRAALAVAAAKAAAACDAAGSEVDRVLRASRGVQARKAELEAQAGSARKLIDGIDGRVPGLNEEKKAAVAGKKFKEAARVNDELKRLGEQREQAERELSASTSGIDAAEQEASTVEAELARVRASAEATERHADLDRIAGLTDAVRSSAAAVRRLSHPTPAAPVTARVLQVDPSTLEALSPSAQEDGEEPADEVLGIDMEGGLSAAQAAAVALLAAQRDALVEELQALAGRAGVVVDSTAIAGTGAGEEVVGGSEEGSHAQVAPASSTSLAALASSTVEARSSSPARQPTPAAAAAVLSPAQVTTPEEEEEEGEGEGESAAAEEVPVVSGFGFALGGSTPGAGEGEGEEGSMSLLAALTAASGGAAPVVVSGFGFGGFGGEEAAAAVKEAPAGPSPEALAAARALRLRDTARAALADSAAVTEKEGQISEAVGREEYDVADALQADIDALLAHREALLAEAAAEGCVSGEELEAAAGAEVDEELAAQAAGAQAVPAATGFSFM